MANCTSHSVSVAFQYRSAVAAALRLASITTKFSVVSFAATFASVWSGTVATALAYRKFHVLDVVATVGTNTLPAFHPALSVVIIAGPCAALAGPAAAKLRLVMVAPAAAAVKSALVMRLRIDSILPFRLPGPGVTSDGLWGGDARPVPGLPL
jgi:hypothetical protein